MGTNGLINMLTICAIAIKKGWLGGVLLKRGSENWHNSQETTAVKSISLQIKKKKAFILGVFLWVLLDLLKQLFYATFVENWNSFLFLFH